MKITRSVTMLVTLIILSSGFNNVFAKNIQPGKAYVCTSPADCKQKCEDDGNTWKPDTSGTTHGTCTKKKSNSTTLKGQMTNKVLVAPLVMPTVTPTKKINTSPAISQPNIKPISAPTVPARQQTTTPEKYIGETEKGKISPSASSLLPQNKPTTGIKTAPAIKNNSKAPVRLPKGNVKTLKPALVSPTPIGVPIPYPNTPRGKNLHQAQEGQSSGGFVPLSKAPNSLVAPGLKNNNSNTNVASAPGEATNKSVSLSVTSDSVVATAIVVVDANQKSMTMDWGDGESKTLDFRAIGHAGSTSNEIAPNTYRFQHVYKKPFHGSYLIYAVSTDEQGRKSSDAISYRNMNPRYKLSFYSIILKFPDHLDSIFEEDSEVVAKLVVKRGEQTLINKIWADKIRTGGTNLAVENEPGKRAIRATWKIEDSIFSTEILYSDEPISIDLNLSERDFSDGGTLNSIISAPGRALQELGHIISGFDPSNSGRMPFSIHPNDGFKKVSGSHTVNYDIGTNEGKIIAEFAFDIKLIVPVDASSEMMLSK